MSIETIKNLKTIKIAFLFVLLISQAACSQTYTCECTVTNNTTGEKSQKYSEMRKTGIFYDASSEAEEWCDNQASSFDPNETVDNCVVQSKPY